jgi:paraquat-inducible protein B
MGRTLTGLETSVAAINGIVSAPGARQLPAELGESLRELRRVLAGFSGDSEVYQNLSASLTKLDRALENLGRLTGELAARPSSVILEPAYVADPIPGGER